MPRILVSVAKRGSGERITISFACNGSSSTMSRERERLVLSPTVTIVVPVLQPPRGAAQDPPRDAEACDYDLSLIDVVVVDNASEDGSAEMVAAEFPDVR